MCIRDRLLTLYRQNDTPPPLDYEMLSDYEGIRSNIACKLIHAVSNEAILKDVPHIPWMDLAIVFYPVSYTHLIRDGPGQISAFRPGS